MQHTVPEQVHLFTRQTENFSIRTEIHNFIKDFMTSGPPTAEMGSFRFQASGTISGSLSRHRLANVAQVQLQEPKESAMQNIGVRLGHT